MFVSGKRFWEDSGIKAFGYVGELNPPAELGKPHVWRDVGAAKQI
jgi:hypothetical protein